MPNVTGTVSPTYPLRPTKLALDAASCIGELVFSGQLAPGTRIRPQDLTSMLGVSTTPIREALVLLEKEGLVNLEPRRGYSVARLARGDIRDVFKLAAHVESILVQRTIDSLVEADLRALEELDASIAHEAATGEPVRVGELNRLFHDTITRRTTDPQLLHRFMSLAWRFRPVHFYALIPGWIEATRHGEIIEALRARDAARVAAAIRAHTEASCELLIRHLESTGFFEAGTGHVATSGKLKDSKNTRGGDSSGRVRPYDP